MTYCQVWQPISSNMFSLLWDLAEGIQYWQKTALLINSKGRKMVVLLSCFMSCKQISGTSDKPCSNKPSWSGTAGLCVVTHVWFVQSSAQVLPSGSISETEPFPPPDTDCLIEEPLKLSFAFDENDSPWWNCFVFLYRLCLSGSQLFSLLLVCLTQLGTLQRFGNNFSATIAERVCVAKEKETQTWRSFCSTSKSTPCSCVRPISCLVFVPTDQVEGSDPGQVKWSKYWLTWWLPQESKYLMSKKKLWVFLRMLTRQNLWRLRTLRKFSLSSTELAKGDLWIVVIPFASPC